MLRHGWVLQIDRKTDIFYCRIKVHQRHDDCFNWLLLYRPLIVYSVAHNIHVYNSHNAISYNWKNLTIAYIINLEMAAPGCKWRAESPLTSSVSFYQYGANAEAFFKVAPPISFLHHRLWLGVQEGFPGRRLVEDAFCCMVCLFVDSDEKLNCYT